MSVICRRDFHVVPVNGIWPTDDGSCSISEGRNIEGAKCDTANVIAWHVLLTW